MKIHDLFDLLLLFVIMVIGIMTTVVCLAHIDSQIRDYTMGDKATITTLKDNAPEPFQYTTKDVLLMYVIADDYQPYPATLQVNDGAITSFNQTYFLDTNTAINNLWNSELNSLMTKSVTGFNIIYDSDGGNVRWKVTTN